ncbi:hypothetical protein SS05631_a45800 (plasmid) [Sinorhizobium sp. CCBAU 05631]|nr:hypothetical protein SS05631_a45800 [Sinorhizobium sp. CCBAU 05631]
MDRFSWFEKAFANRSSTNYANEKTGSETTPKLKHRYDICPTMSEIGHCRISPHQRAPLCRKQDAM